MPPRRTVFVGSDFILNPALDEIGARLADAGVDVLRGPRATPTQHVTYAPEQYRSLFERAEVLVMTTRTPVEAAMLDAAPRLRGVVFPSIGVDTIDVAEATARRLVVAHAPVPEIHIGMAEATVMLIAALLLDLPGKTRQLAQRLPRPEKPSARSVHGRTIGLVGLGRISRGVAERLSGWGCRIVVHDHAPAGKVLPDGAQWVDLPTLLRESDVVSLHVTLGPTSRSLIGEAELRSMKPTAYLVNTSRGQVVDEAALTRALQEERIAGAALDTFQTEPLPDTSPLRELPNLILTNHCIGHTLDLTERIPAVAVENVTRILEGRHPVFVKNPEVLPEWDERFPPGAHDAGRT
jgi:D-3-phosphoglycerate dehydrogenase